MPTGDVLRAPATVYSDCSTVEDGSGGESFNEQAEIFDPKTGINVPLPAPSIAAGQELVRSECIVGGDIDNIRVFYVMTVSTPSSGLDPEKLTSSIVSFDPFNPGPPTTKPLPPEIDPEKVGRLRPTRFGFFIEGQNPGQSLASQYVGIDGATLNTTFVVDGSGPVPQTSANESAFLIYFYGGDVRIHSAQDGRVLGEYKESNSSGPYPNGFIVDVDETRFGVQNAFFNTDDNQVKQPFAAGGGDMWGNTYLALEDHALEVRDAATNAVKLRREGADFDGLNIDKAYVAGDFLYLQNDSDNPVIDIETTRKVSSDWTVRPTDVVNRDWILVKETRAKSDGDASCFNGDELRCGDDVSLRYAPDGRFAGPWY